MTWPSCCWDIAHCDCCCCCRSHCCMLGNVNNSCCTTILYFGMLIPPLPALLLVAISVGYWNAWFDSLCRIPGCLLLTWRVDPLIGDDELLFVCLDLEREGEREEERRIFDGELIIFFSGLLELLDDQGMQTSLYGSTRNLVNLSCGWITRTMSQLLPSFLVPIKK